MERAGNAPGESSAPRGTLVWDGRGSLRAEIAGGPRKGLFDEVTDVPVPPLNPADGFDGHLGVISGFVRAVRSGTEPETVGHDNIRSLAMAFGAIRSADAG